MLSPIFDARISFLVKVIVIISLELQSVSMFEPGCAKPLGLIHGEIQDWQISASSSLLLNHNNDHDVKFARVHQPGSKGWCADYRRPQQQVVGSHHWLLVDLGVVSGIGGLIVQGIGDLQKWTTLFSISTSVDAYKWEFILDLYGSRRLFVGNVNSHQTQTIWFEEALSARFFKVHLEEWEGGPCLRLELIGCQDCLGLVSGGGGIGNGLTASTTLPWDKSWKSSSSSSSSSSSNRRTSRSSSSSCEAADGHLYTRRGWCARHNNLDQWLQFELGVPSLVTGIITRGRGDSERKEWVTAYTVSYSNDTMLWYYYKEQNQQNIKIFGGNMDKSTERRHYLNSPFIGRYVRIHPLKWFNHISMRGGILGCPLKHVPAAPAPAPAAAAAVNTTNTNPGATSAGAKADSVLAVISHVHCPPSFFRLHELAPCWENLAHKKEVWSNDRKHFWEDWKQGQLSLAVDGNEENSLHKCTLLDNYYTDHPVLMVDLGRKVHVNGVILINWQGDGQDTVTTYRDYVSNLENVTVFLSNTARLDSAAVPPVAVAPASSGAAAADSSSYSGFQNEEEQGVGQCGTITRENNAVFNARLHFDCASSSSSSRRRKKGRYVYIQPNPTLYRWSRIFNFVICEILIY